MRSILAVCLLLLVATTLVSIPAQAGENWEAWQPMPDHPGMMYRLRCEDRLKPEQPHMWWVEFQNGLTERVSFDFRVTRKNETNVHYGDRVTINPGKTQAGWNTLDDRFGVEVHTANWKFGPDAS